MKILLTFAGERDPSVPYFWGPAAHIESSVFCLLKRERFDCVYIFRPFFSPKHWQPTPDEISREIERLRSMGVDPTFGSRDALVLSQEIERQYPEIKTTVVDLPLDSLEWINIPSFSLALNNVVQGILNDAAHKNASYFICTSSGTPEMRIAWFYILKQGWLPITLFVVDPELLGPPRVLEPTTHAALRCMLNWNPRWYSIAQMLILLEIESYWEALRWRADRESLLDQIDVEGIVGKSKALQQALKTLKKIAPSNIPILLLGESGTGKELFAKLTHAWSERRHKAFITVDCGAISETLAETEFFGHEKNAFTGARTAKVGKFELADGGTLFLDEIGNLSPKAQGTLLRALEDGEIAKVGSQRQAAKRVDVRIISATKENLKNLIRDGRFRDDLYFRLSGMPIYLPSLRDRREDIPLLIEYFLDKLPQSIKPKQLSGVVKRVIMNYSWPGNVRELDKVLQRMAWVCEGSMITEACIPPEITSAETIQAATQTEVTTPAIPADGLDLEKDLTELRKGYFNAALNMTDGNAAAAARLLQIQPHTFRKQAQKFGLNNKE